MAGTFSKDAPEMRCNMFGLTRCISSLHDCARWAWRLADCSNCSRRFAPNFRNWRKIHAPMAVSMSCHCGMGSCGRLASTIVEISLSGGGVISMAAALFELMPKQQPPQQEPRRRSPLPMSPTMEAADLLPRSPSTCGIHRRHGARLPATCLPAVWCILLRSCRLP